MGQLKSFNLDKIWQGRLDYGDKLLESITKICKQNNIISGRITAIGAVQSAVIGYYDQIKKEYISESIDESMEVLSLQGNISKKDNEVFVHIHVVLGKSDLTTVGGHLFNDTKVFALEYEIESFKEDNYNREYEPKTGLFLWK